MEPTFDSNQSAEFDKSSHHILKARDVVFALRELNEPSEYGVVTDAEYINWIYDVFTSGNGFGKTDYGRAIEALQGVSNNESGEFEQEVIDKMTDIINTLKSSYAENAYETAEELNTFLSKYPNLFLRSENPNETISEILVSVRSTGELEPMITIERDTVQREYPVRLFSETLYIDINQLSEEYRRLINEVLVLHGIE